jgi:hypothetical protein
MPPSHGSSRWLLIVAAAVCARATAGAVARNAEFVGEPPARVPLDVDGEEVASALRYVLTEMKRLSNRYRYITLVKLHGAAQGEAAFSGRNTFLDLEFDMLKGQLSRHDVIVFRDEDGAISGMAIDEFPEVRLRELPDPDV